VTLALYALSSTGIGQATLAFCWVKMEALARRAKLDA
jgi:hypothetical protein